MIKKYYLLTFAIFFFLYSCNRKKPINGGREVKTGLVPKRTHHHEDIDTIIEYNNPKFLDFNRHQLFIDTTKNSKYYDEILNWKPNEFDKKAVKYYTEKINKENNFKHFKLGGIPRDWILIHSLNKSFVAYNPANSIDWRFRITNKSVNYYAIEADADVISKVIKLSKDEVVLELKTIEMKSPNLKRFLSIKKTQYPFIYSFGFSETGNFDDSHYRLVTPLKNLKQFNLLVSDAKEHIHYNPKFDNLNEIKLK